MTRQEAVVKIADRIEEIITSCEPVWDYTGAPIDGRAKELFNAFKHIRNLMTDKDPVQVEIGGVARTIK